MAFDRSNPADLLALKNEVLLDPTGRGYNPDAAEAILLDQLNNPAQNLTPATGPDILTPKNVLKALFPAAINSQDQFKIQLIFESALEDTSNISVFRQDLIGLGGQIPAAINGILRDLNRAEVLFSNIDADGTQEFVNISVQDWRAARDS